MKNYFVREAKEIAIDYGHSYTGTEHLIAICLREDDELENALNIDYHDYMIKLIGQVEENENKNINAPLTPLLKSYLKEIEDFTPKSFMIKILEEKDGIGYRMLNELDVNKNALQNLTLYNDIPAALLKNDCLINLNEKVRKNNIHIFNTKEKTNELINNLFKIRKPNVLIIGKAGCGKSALVESLAERINNDDVPYFMKDKIIFEMTISNAVAGTKYRGDFEQKVKDILKDIESCSRAILFIDEVHNIMNAGGAEGAIAMGDILKPYLARGEISLIGATTTDEYRKFISKDKAMNRRFTIMNLETPSDEDIKAILKGWAPKLEEHYSVSIDDATIRNIIIKCKKQKDKTSPDRELDELENWCLKNCNWRGVEWKELVSNK